MFVHARARIALLAVLLFAGPAASCSGPEVEGVRAGQEAAPAQEAEDAVPTQESEQAVVHGGEQEAVVREAIILLEERYVFPEVGRAVADSLRNDLAAGRFAEGTGPEGFAHRLSERIRGISGDGHLWVALDPEPAEAVLEEAAPEEEALDRAEARRRRLARTNFGLPRAEILPGNVGYLEIRQFVDPELGAAAVAGAARFLANAEALILDLRPSSGGSAEMVAHIASYFFDPDPTVHLFGVYHRPDDRTEEFRTVPDLPGPRFPDQPIYLLVRASTFSAGEGLAYVLQQLDRATVVGERTGGGAHPGRLHRLNERFVMFVAEARATSPMTGGNWEGVGVEPDVEVEADAALEHAHRLALETLLAAEGEGEWAEELREQMTRFRERTDEPASR